MEPQELAQYVSQCRLLGLTDQTIQTNLRASGWTDAAIDTALQSTEPSPGSHPVQLDQHEKASSPTQPSQRSVLMIVVGVLVGVLFLGIVATVAAENGYYITLPW